MRRLGVEMNEINQTVEAEPRPATPEDMGAVSVTLTESDDGDEDAEITSDADVAPDCSGMEPFNNFILVWPRRPPKKKGKIIIPEGARTTEVTPDEGEVLAVGPRCTEGLKRGDYVYYWRHAGSWQLAPGDDRKLIRLMKDTEVYGRKKEVPAESDPGASTVPEG